MRIKTDYKIDGTIYLHSPYYVVAVPYNVNEIIKVTSIPHKGNCYVTIRQQDFTNILSSVVKYQETDWEVLETAEEVESAIQNFKNFKEEMENLAKKLIEKPEYSNFAKAFGH